MPAIRSLTRGIKPYVINKAEDGKTAKVNLYGEIVEKIPIDWWTGEKVDGLFIELSSFLDDVETLSGMDEVSFYINSVGGDVYAGISIFNKIRALKAETTTVVDGLAASAAAIVAQAGDKRKVSVGSQTMIHTAAAGLIGYYNRQDLKQVDNTLKSIDKALAELLADRTGRGQDEIMNMLNRTTWMTADEAVSEGFADEVVGKTEPTVDRIADSSMYMVNGIPHNLAGMTAPAFKAIGQYSPQFSFPQFIRNIAEMMTVSNGSEPSDIDNPSNKEVKSMDIQELKATYPDLINEIEEAAKVTAQTEKDEAVRNAVDEAVKAERARIKEIDSIAQGIDAEMVENAKYGENPITAKDLAFMAIQNEQAKAAEFIQDRAEDLKDANVDKVEPAPVSGSEEDTELKDIQDGANLLMAGRK